MVGELVGMYKGCRKTECPYGHWLQVRSKVEEITLLKGGLDETC